MYRHAGLGCCICLLWVAAGCDVSDPNAKARPVANPPGIAPVGMDPMDGGRAAPAGAAPQQPAPQQPAPQQPVAQQPANDGKGLIGKETAKVVDARKAMAENPNLIVFENKSTGNDPLTFAASAYVSLRSTGSTLGFTHWLNTFKGVEGRNPTYEEFMKGMDECKVHFTEVYPYQMYAYDSQAGTIVVLEDPVAKAARYKAAGIPLP